jgi:predicted RNase H-like nuclease
LIIFATTGYLLISQRLADMHSDHVGVDWASGDWVAVAYSTEQNEPEVRVFDEIQAVWEHYGETSHRIVVDIPIGLCEARDAEDCGCKSQDGELYRACDSLARDVVEGRYRSVFTPPAREAVRLAANPETNYREVTEKNESLTGKGVSRQAASISTAIADVDSLLRDSADERVLVEGHPEVCFRAFNGEPLANNKATAAGVEARLSALETVAEYSEGDWRTLAESLGTVDRSIELDDLLDALVLALTAFAEGDEDRSLPPDPPTDSEDLLMQIVYRSETALVDKK